MNRGLLLFDSWFCLSLVSQHECNLAPELFPTTVTVFLFLSRFLVAVQLFLTIFIFGYIDRVATDHNEDNTTTILRDWLVKVQNLYHYVEWRPKEEPRCVTLKMHLHSAQRGHRAHEIRFINI